MLKHSERGEGKKVVLHSEPHRKRTPGTRQILDRITLRLDSSGQKRRDRLSYKGVPLSSQRAGRDSSDLRKKGSMLRSLTEIADFVRRVSAHARFGRLSRAPLELLRVEIRGDVAECEWIARPPDAWDASLPQLVGQRNASQQALEDAIAVRGLLLRTLPNLKSAVLRVYRQSLAGLRDLIITGNVSRDARPAAAVRSLAMRAKLYGLQFWLEEGVLEALRAEDRAVNA